MARWERFSWALLVSILVVALVLLRNQATYEKQRCDRAEHACQQLLKERQDQDAFLAPILKAMHGELDELRLEKQRVEPLLRELDTRRRQDMDNLGRQ
jgi:hypothetical protein